MNKIKLIFRLTKDCDDYPPFDTEALWAESSDGMTYTVVNIPFFAKQATLGDVVTVKEEDGQYLYDRVVSRSQNSLIRVVVLKDDRLDEIRAKLRRLGCESELFREPAVIAVNVPIAVDLAPVQSYLTGLEKRKIATYEEPILRHPE